MDLIANQKDYIIEAFTCPYCGDEMKRGYIQSPRPICWLPKKLKLFSNTGFTRNGAVVLSGGKLLAAPCVTAYNCTRCKKIIIGYQATDTALEASLEAKDNK